MDICLKTTCSLRTREKYSTYQKFNQILLQHITLQALYQASENGRDWLIFIHSKDLNMVTELFKSLDISFVLQNTYLHLRNIEYDLSRIEINENVTHMFSGADDVFIFDKIEGQFSMPTNILLNDEAYAEALENMRDGGDHIVYLPLIRRPCYLRFWTDDGKSRTRRKKESKYRRTQSKISKNDRTSSRTFNWGNQKTKIVKSTSEMEIVDNTVQEDPTPKNQIKSNIQKENNLERTLMLLNANIEQNG